MNLVHSGPIPVPFLWNSTIPVPFLRNPVIPADSGAIPAELPDSGWNLWGTVKYWTQTALPKLWAHIIYFQIPF